MLAKNASIAGQYVAEVGQEASSASPLPHTPIPAHNNYGWKTRPQSCIIACADLGGRSKKSLLGDFSITASARQNAINRAFRSGLAAISSDGFPEQDRISRELMLLELDQRITDYSLKTYEMPLTQFRGIHTDLADIPRSLPFHSVKDYEDYVTRSHEMPLAFKQTIEVLKQGEKDGLMPVRFLLEQIPAQCQGIVAEDPFLLPTKKFPSSISAADQKRLTEEIDAAANNEVLPAYKRFGAYVADDYAPHGRTAIGMSSLPDEARRYQNAIHEETTTSMTPAEIHALGLQEIARINGLLTDLAHKAGYTDLKGFRAAINSDPKYIPTSSDQSLKTLGITSAKWNLDCLSFFSIILKLSWSSKQYLHHNRKWVRIMSVARQTEAPRAAWSWLLPTMSIDG